MSTPKEHGLHVVVQENVIFVLFSNHFITVLKLMAIYTLTMKFIWVLLDLK